MPGQTVEGSREQWERVAAYVVRRRATRSSPQAKGGPSTSVWSRLENPGKQSRFAVASLTKASLALGWTADSIELILAGGEPIEAQADSSPLSENERLTNLEHAVAELIRVNTEMLRAVQAEREPSERPARSRR